MLAIIATGRQFTPRMHVALSVLLHSTTGSSTLVDDAYTLGVGITYDKLRCVLISMADVSLANYDRELRVLMPLQFTAGHDTLEGSSLPIGKGRPMAPVPALHDADTSDIPSPTSNHATHSSRGRERSRLQHCRLEACVEASLDIPKIIEAERGTTAVCAASLSAYPSMVSHVVQVGAAGTCARHC
jgi:hypothetical protein